MPNHSTTFAALLTALVLGVAARERSEHSRDIEADAIPRPPIVHRMPPQPRAAFGGGSITNLTVYVVPHSHDDTGWQRTVDQYYEEEVRYIYDSVVAALAANPARKFIFVETAFFMRWWREQSDETQGVVRELFASGQLEFVNGAWCMADDASPNIDMQIDQITLGHRYIADTLGPQYVPKYAWHIDPFGLSASYALWFRRMNYSAWLFNRVDTRLKDLWHNQTRLQFSWEPSGAGSNPGIFAHVLDTHYGSPNIKYKDVTYSFDWEVFGGLGGGENPGNQIPVADTVSPFYASTIDAIAEAYVAMARLRAGWYRLGAPYQRVPEGTGTLMVPFGDDMKFQNAHKQYSNMDRLIKYINANFDRFGVHVVYGTIGDYMKTVAVPEGSDAESSGSAGTAARAQPDWPTYAGDFFPLATNLNVYSDQLDWNVEDSDKSTEYWTGHYTTRPLMKSLTARAGAVRHAAEIAASLRCAADNPPAFCSNGAAAREAPAPGAADLLLARAVTSVLQHHDSITGTSKPDVTSDLDVRLLTSVSASQRIVYAAVAGSPSDAPPLGPAEEPEYTVGDRAVVFNPMLQARTEAVTLVLRDDAPGTLAVVDGATGEPIRAAIVPPVPGKRFDTSFPGASKAQLVILAEVPPLSARTFEIRKSENGSTMASKWDCGLEATVGATIRNSFVSIAFSAETGRMSQINVTLPNSTDGALYSSQVEQELIQYISSDGSNAYQFAPNRTDAPFGAPVAGGAKPQLCRFEAGEEGGSAWLQRVTQTYGQPDLVRTTVTVVAGVPTVEAQTQFIMATQDRELVSRYKTGIRNTVPGEYNINSTKRVAGELPVFETDSNGYLMMRRVTNKTGWGRDEEYFHVTLPVAGNYYPLSGNTGAIRIADQSNSTPANRRGGAAPLGAFGVLTDTAHGAAALQEGWVEVMLGRRCAEQEDISVDDTDPVTLKNYIIAGPDRSYVAVEQRKLATRLSAPLVASQVKAGKPGMRAGSARVSPGGSAPAIPDAIHMLSLDRVGVETTDPKRASRVLLRLMNIYQEGEGAAPGAVKVQLDALLSPAGVEIDDVIELPLNGVGQGEPVDVGTPVAFDPLQIRTFELTIRQKQG